MKPIILVLLLASLVHAQGPGIDPNKGDPETVNTLQGFLESDYRRVTEHYAPDTAVGQIKTSYGLFLQYADQLVNALVGVNVVVPNDVAIAYTQMTTGRTFARLWFNIYDQQHTIISERHDDASARIFDYAVTGTLEDKSRAIIAVEDHRVACDSLIDHSDDLPTPQQLTGWLDALTIVSDWAANR